MNRRTPIALALLLAFGAGHSAAARKPEPESADQFVARVNKSFSDIYNELTSASWLAATYINEDSQRVESAANQRSLTMLNGFLEQAKRYRGDYRADTARALQLIRLSTAMPAPQDPAQLKELTEIVSRLGAAYGAGKYCPDAATPDDCLEIGEISDILADTQGKSYEELERAWKGWHTISVPMRKDYQRFVELTNTGAREMGFANTGDQWRSGYDMSPADFHHLLHESYVSELTYLARYLKERRLELGNVWTAFVDWAENNPDHPALQGMRTPLDYGADMDFEELHAVEAKLTDDDRQEIAELAQRDNPAEAPSWSYLTFERLLPRTTWLVHKSDDASNIADHGFKRGFDDVATLGLTTYWKKNEPGYNFAYVADDADPEKYGDHAVMFQSAAVLCYHDGDEEDQAIFWGPAVDPRSIIHLNHDDGWTVRAADGRPLFQTDRLRKAVAWVKANADSYRKPLGYQP